MAMGLGLSAGRGFAPSVVELRLSNLVVPSGVEAGDIIGDLSVSSSLLTWTYSLLPGYDADGAVEIDGADLIATGEDFAAGEIEIRIKAVSTSPVYREMAYAFFLQAPAPVPMGGYANMARGYYTGLLASAADVVGVTRSGNGYAFTSAGTLSTFGTDTPRITDRYGVSVSAAKTQAVSNHLDMGNASWTKSNCTIDSTPYLGPDGATQFSKVIPNTSSASHTVNRSSMTIAAGETTDIGFVVEFDAGLPLASVRIDINGSGSNCVAICLDLERGCVLDGPYQVGTSPGLRDLRIRKLGKRLVEIDIQHGVAPSGASSLRIYYSPLPASIYPTPAANPFNLASPSLGPAYVGDGVSGHRVWMNFARNTQGITPFILASTAGDNLALKPAVIDAYNAPRVGLRFRFHRAWVPYSGGQPLLIGDGVAILSQLTSRAVTATIGGETAKVQLGSGNWMNSDVDVVLYIDGTSCHLVANGGPEVAWTATKAEVAALKLLQSADGATVGEGSVPIVEFRHDTMTEAQRQAWSMGAYDPLGDFAYWHDSSAFSRSAGKLTTSASFKGAGAMTPASGAEPTVVEAIDQRLAWIEFTGGDRVSLPDPFLLDGTKVAHFGFKVRPRDPATRNSELGATNTVLAQGAFRIQELADGLRVVVPHATTDLIADFPKSHFTDDACCLEFRVDPTAANDADKVALFRNTVAISPTITQASSGAFEPVTGETWIGALSDGSEPGSFDACAVYAYSGVTEGARVHDMITLRQFGEAARCQLVAGGDVHDEIFQGSDGAGLALDYWNATDLDNAGSKSLQSFSGSGGDNKLVVALFGGPTSAANTQASNTYNSPLKMGPRYQYLTGMFAPAAPIIAGRKIRFGADNGNTRRAMYGLIEHFNFCAAYHSSGLNRIGPQAGDADDLAFEGTLPNGSTSVNEESALAPKYYIARNNTLWGSQDEALSITGWANNIYAIDNVGLAYVIGLNPGGYPSSWFANESNHAYFGLIGYGANENFSGREYIFDIARRGREWDAHDVNIDLDITGRQQNSFCFGQFSQDEDNGFATFGSKGEHTDPPFTIIENAISIDFIGIGAAAGRFADVKRQTPPLGQGWDEPFVAAQTGRGHGVAKAFVGGPVWHDGRPFGTRRNVQSGGDPVRSNSVDRANLADAPAFIRRDTCPPILTEVVLRRELRERGGANRMPAWVKARMDLIERGEAYGSQGMLTSTYNDRDADLGNAVTQYDPSTFAADHLTPFGLTWGVRYTPDVLLPWLRGRQEAVLRRGAARFT